MRPHLAIPLRKLSISGKILLGRLIRLYAPLLLSALFLLNAPTPWLAVSF
ncbi:hypothetical protein [Candidatus Reidiella endopervernicosa]|uniref:Uncharacterized protein n=1 Tax=Candidatus Reidiella endopervernicosa TaxID=2738883 RepID=A0A6N0HVD0_9GAMM|nr:hypothetical protein [Candidatus Reidiella endopervernicosa]QKQ26344.1 hypothetical protein HUE57_08660 [Candidatus Reidiella endopervernicosa]